VNERRYHDQRDDSEAGRDLDDAMIVKRCRVDALSARPAS